MILNYIILYYIYTLIFLYNIYISADSGPQQRGARYGIRVSCFQLHQAPATTTATTTTTTTTTTAITTATTTTKKTHHFSRISEATATTTTARTTTLTTTTRTSTSQQVQPTTQLAKSSFSSDSDDTLGSFCGYVTVRFWHEIRWCFSISNCVRQHSCCTCG